jgi:hypothetical protein
MLHLLRLLFVRATRSFHPRRDLLLENLALRQQLAALKGWCLRVRLTVTDKWFWVMLRRFWPGWRQALMLVQPETVVGWHRAGFKLYWQCLSRHHSAAGRGCVSKGFDNGKGLQQRAYSRRLRVLLVEVTSILFSIIYGIILSAMSGTFGGTSALCVNTRWNFSLMGY